MDYWISFYEKTIDLLTYEISVGEGRVSLLALIGLLLLMIPAAIISRLVQRVLSHKVLPHISGIDKSTEFLILKLTHYTIMVVAVLVILSSLGVNLTSLTVLFGLLSVGIGFGLQNLAANFISGIIILFERPIKVGDWVVINDMEGVVKEVNLRATSIETNDAEYIIVPNQEILSNNIVNHSKGEPRVRIQTPVGVTYKADMKLVHDVLVKVAQGHPKVLRDPEPEAWMVGFGASSVDWHLQTWIQYPRERYRITSELYLATWWALKQNGIEIPFPQRDLHLRSADLPLPIRVGPSLEKEASNGDGHGPA